MTVPSESKTTLLLFLRPGQLQSEEQITLLAPLLKERTDVQVIAIVSGDDAVTAAAKLGQNAKFSGAIVADADYAASGKFAARVWPTTVVISRSTPKAPAEQVAHIAGLPVSFANDLAAYLDFSAGKIDKAALARQLADRQVVADTPDQKAARHVEVAQRLALKGARDESRKEIASALALNPKDDALLLAIARAHLVSHDAGDAAAMLAKLKDASSGGGELHLLKAWILLEQQKFEEAKSLLTQSVKLNPNPAEAYYLLGKVYEHENNAKEAAGCFKKAFEHSAAGKGMGV